MIWIMLYNIIAIGCLTYLSVVFNKWWIVLFALLFTIGFKSYKEDKNESREDSEDK